MSSTQRITSLALAAASIVASSASAVSSHDAPRAEHCTVLRELGLTIRLPQQLTELV